MPLVADHQLDNARVLATHDSRRPRETSLRRAVSTAYYALFQALCLACANTLVNLRRPFRVYTPMFRSVDHSTAAQALEARHWLDAPHVRQIGSALAELRAAREWADYNPEPRPNYDEATNAGPFTRAEALRLIGTAELAIQVLERLDADTRLRLVVRLVAKQRR
jgi:hypothetical protein